MRILFSVHNPWYVRHYDAVLQRLCARGHSVCLVADGLGKREVWPESVHALARDTSGLTLHWTPVAADEPWFELGTRIRQALYYLRFLQPAYDDMPMLLAACRDTEYSFDATFSGRPNGAFTYVALTTLAQLAPGASYRDWLRAIRAQLPSQNYPQTPALQATQAQLAWPLLA